ncbi:MAG: hypothetical protein HP002_02445 [Lentisphaeria bacterium]|nr:hypothetical protein [Lentisphaeria bacterium]
MNQLIFALMAGTHHHRYTDNSGQCSLCHREHSPHEYENGACTVCGFDGCAHPEGCTDLQNGTHRCPVCGAVNEHVWFADPTETRCRSCEVCEAEQPHQWQDGVCSRCSYECAHPSFVLISATQHRCEICNKQFPHDLSFVHEEKSCQYCSICHRSIAHDFSNRNESGCGRCSKCGDTYGTHTWGNGTGICTRCGYNCTHQTVTNNVCTTCGYSFIKPDAAYWVLSGSYAGSYVSAGSVNGQSYYRQYVYSNGNWVEGSYYLVVLRISSITQFGGNYAYKGSGAVFTTSISNFPINDTLLTGSGKYRIHLEQYELDGTFKAKGDYTSSDCSNLTGRLP